MMAMKQAITAALVLLATVPAEAACRYVKFGSLPIDTAARSPRIDGSVNGRPIKVLVDTGASITSLTRGIAERAELPLSHSFRGAFGIGGESEEYHASVRELVMGPARWNNVRMSVVWDGAADVDAILGANFLLQNDIELLLKDKVINFFRPEDCKNTFLGYWDPDAIVLPLVEKGPKDLRAEVMIEVNGQPVRTLIDSGAHASLIDEKVAAKLGVRKPTDGSAVEGAAAGVGTRQVATWIGRFDSVAIGPEVIQHARLTVMDMWGAARQDLRYSGSGALDDAPQMVLGADFLASHRVLFAMSQRKLYLSHLGGPVFAKPAAAEPAVPPASAPASAP
ncbi:aspartyl protease family protein [Ideonella sp.]|uniref:aspartyl protease family protein n=1 Tax=Ideonella sp. TaxID=1929293 RepID=UPI0035B4DA97